MLRLTLLRPSILVMAVHVGLRDNHAGRAKSSSALLLSCLHLFLDVHIYIIPKP